MILSDKKLLKFLVKNKEITLKSNRLTEDFTSVWDAPDNWIKNLNVQHNYFLQTKKDKNFQLYLKGTPNLESYLRMIAFLDLIYKHDNLSLQLSEIEKSIKNKSPLPSNFSMPILIFGLFPNLFFYSKQIADAVKFKEFTESFEQNGPLKAESKNFIDYHLDYVNSLIHYCETFTTFHPYLYLKGKRYRDHLLHSIRVMWLMDELFKKWENLYSKSCWFRLKKLLQNITPDFRNISDKTIYTDRGYKVVRHGRRNCMISGLFHDICYPVAPFEYKPLEADTKIKWIDNHLNQISKLSIPTFEQGFCTYDFEMAIKSIYASKSAEYKNDLYRKAIEMYKTFNIDNDLKNFFKKNLLDHGVFSSILLNNVFNESIQAISLHNVSDKKIDLIEQPIGFMLVLCDELQEWGRWLRKKNSETYYIPVETETIKIKENELDAKIDFYKNRDEILRCDKDFSIRKIVVDKFTNLSRLSVSKEIGIEINIKISIIGLKKEKCYIKYSSSLNKWSMSIENHSI